jgi:hypothetical protein
MPRHPHARQGVPPSGGVSARQRPATELRGVVEVVVELVADPVVGLRSVVWRSGLFCSRA